MGTSFTRVRGRYWGKSRSLQRKSSDAFPSPYSIDRSGRSATFSSPKLTLDLFGLVIYFLTRIRVMISVELDFQ